MQDLLKPNNKLQGVQQEEQNITPAIAMLLHKCNDIPENGLLSVYGQLVESPIWFDFQN